MANVYVASSWRNTETLDVVIDALRDAGHTVYDFRADEYFQWEQVDPTWDRAHPQIEPERLLALLASPISQRGPT